MANSTIDQFFQDFETLPKLISVLALSIADAQSRLDASYLDSLSRLTKMAGELKSQNIDLATTGFLELFKAMGPSRYQFTETTVDVRADLRMSSGNEFQVGGSFGLQTPMFAVAVNASYLQRTSADFQSSALIHCVINAVSSDAAVMQKLIDAAPKLDPGSLKPNDISRSILDGWRGVVGVPIPLSISPDVLTGKTGGHLDALTAAPGTGPYHFTMTPPNPAAGVTLNADGTFAGNLAAVGNDSDVTIKVDDSSKPALTGSRQYTIKITAA
jgi:hypothetical protein